MTHSLEDFRQTRQQAALEPELEGVYLGPLDESMKRRIDAIVPLVEAVDVMGSPALQYAAAAAIEHTHHPKHASHAA